MAVLRSRGSGDVIGDAIDRAIDKAIGNTVKAIVASVGRAALLASLSAGFCLGTSLAHPSVAIAQESEIQSGDVIVVTSESATVYAEPSEDAKVKATLKKGRRAQVSGPAQGGYLPLQTKTGSGAWIREEDVTIERKETRSSENDVVEPAARPPRARAVSDGAAHMADTEPASKPKSESSGLIQGVSFDLGASTGSYGGKSYTEANLGINTYFSRFLAWRNSIFGRFQPSVTVDGVDYGTIYGVDTSLRAILGINGVAAGLTSFAGPGYRFVNKGENVPFAEAGVVVRLLFFNIGGGAKVLMNSWNNKGAENDTQYFLILAGGGSL